MVREKMQKVSISNTNELINYNSNDEIGDLVREYNRMLTELKKSAEILAKNERESAWAEMAKQVAHEVKNPLTPIKLGIQYLDKAWDDEKPDFGERFKKYKNTLIEQIDTLSRIASEFSDFAKVRNIKKESLNITDLLKNCLSFAQNERENLEIKYNQDKTEDIFVEADKEHLIRVINNLLKNAIQAIPEDKMGLVEVSLETLDQEILISISDNGNGVEEVIKDKIFTPNFTTKSTGSGLGLAMCKRIVETAGGEIYFETQQNLGSTFFVKLPK
jgi:nitrogen fixation/metabolism regulation signal transduction histidine kinase